MTVQDQTVRKDESHPAPRTPSRLDALDVRLVQSFYFADHPTLPLNQHFRKSYREIARRLGVDQDTVRARVKRLTETGFLLHGPRLVLNPRILGLYDHAVWFDVPSTVPRSELLSSLKLLPDVFIITSSAGSMVGVIFRYVSDSDRMKKIELMRKLANASNMTGAYVPWPEVAIRLQLLDWKIIKSLRHNPHKSTSMVARELGVSSRTVKRRLDRMIEAHVLFAMPGVNPRALEGTLIADVPIGVAPDCAMEIDRRVRSKIGQYILHSFHMTPTEPDGTHYYWPLIVLPNVSKAREIREWINQQPGVRDVRVELKEDHLILFESIDEHVERKLASLTPN